MKTVGLTGGIGCGKSTAAKILSELGAQIIDADRLGHEAYLPRSEGWRRVVGAFGPEVVAADGTINRQRLGAIVFADPARLARVNSIVHPLIRRAIGERIDARRASGWAGTIVVEAALLVEAKWMTLVDELWLVVASRHAIFDRVKAQRGLDRGAIEARVEAQMSDNERRRYADVVVDNSGTVAEMRAQLLRLWRERRLVPPASA